MARAPRAGHVIRRVPVTSPCRSIGRLLSESALCYQLPTNAQRESTRRVRPPSARLRAPVRPAIGRRWSTCRDAYGNIVFVRGARRDVHESRAATVDAGRAVPREHSGPGSRTGPLPCVSSVRPRMTGVHAVVWDPSPGAQVAGVGRAAARALLEQLHRRPGDAAAPAPGVGREQAPRTVLRQGKVTPASWNSPGGATRSPRTAPTARGRPRRSGTAGSIGCNRSGASPSPTISDRLVTPCDRTIACARGRSLDSWVAGAEILSAEDACDPARRPAGQPGARRVHLRVSFSTQVVQG